MVINHQIMLHLIKGKAKRVKKVVLTTLSLQHKEWVWFISFARLLYLFRGQGTQQSQLHMGEGPLQDESPAHCSAHCYVNNCGISTLPKGPSALFWRLSVTFSYYQKKCFVCTGLERKTVCFSVHSSKDWATIFSHFTSHLNYSSISSTVQFNN